jgi:hypothetical protein
MVAEISSLGWEARGSVGVAETTMGAEWGDVGECQTLLHDLFLQGQYSDKL